MYWQTRFNRQPRNQKLEEKITELHKEHKDFGYRRMHGMLIKLGYHVNKKRVQRIMQKLKFQVSSFTRKSRKYSSYKGKVGNIAPNRIHRRFRTSIPHQKITTDTSEFKYYEVDKSGRMVIKKLYLDPFMDMYNSEIISYSISRNPSSQAIVSALTQAIEATKKYIESFGDNLTLMRILPYFIEKNNESELLTTIENLEDVAPNNDDWIHTMV